MCDSRVQEHKNMKRIRTTIILYVTTLIFGGYGVSIGDLGGERKNLEHNIFAVSVTESDKSLWRRTYRPINQPSTRDDSDDYAGGESFDITLKGSTNQAVDTTLLISTTSKDSCEATPRNENELLPVWKIDNEVREFRLKINQRTTKELDGLTLFLCVYNEYLGRLQHLDERSALTFVNRHSSNRYSAFKNDLKFK